MRWMDGKFVGGDSPALVTEGIGLFESMAAVGGRVPLWSRHLARLSASAQRLQLPFELPDDLPAQAAELLAHNSHHDGALRLALLPDNHWEMTSRNRSYAPSTVRLIPTLQRRGPEAPPADLKAMPRSFYDAVRREAQGGGADDGIILGDDGAVLETAQSNLFLWLDGSWVTPPLDGRVLPGIARALLLERARPPITERVCTIDDLHRARKLMVSNAVHGPRAAVLVASPDPTVEPLDSSLQQLWRDCMQA